MYPLPSCPVVTSISPGESAAPLILPGAIVAYPLGNSHPLSRTFARWGAWYCPLTIPQRLFDVQGVWEIVITL